MVVTGRAERYVDVQTVQDHVDACFQASLAGIDLAKCRKPGVPAREGKGEVWRVRAREREAAERARQTEKEIEREAARKRGDTVREEIEEESKSREEI